MQFLSSTTRMFEIFGIYFSFYLLYLVYLPKRLLNSVKLNREINKQKMMRKEKLIEGKDHVEILSKKYMMCGVEEKVKEILIGDKYIRNYYLSEIPSVIELNGLDNISNLPFEHNISIHLIPNNKAQMLRLARERKSVLESIQLDKEQKGKSTKAEVDMEIQDLNSFIEDLVYEVEKSFNVSVVGNISSNSFNELKQTHNKFDLECLDNDFIFNPTLFNQKNTYLSNLPLLEKGSHETHLLQTSSVVNLLPLTGSNLNDPSGIFLGISMGSNTLVISDMFKARNANITILGTSGSGKSVTAKILIHRFFLQGIHSIIIDPEGEYTKLTKVLGGEVVNFTDDNGINIFQIDKSLDIVSYISNLKIFLSFFIEELHYHPSLLDSSLMEFCQQTKVAKTLENFIKLLSTKYSKEMAQDLEVLLTGSLRGLFTGERQLKLTSHIICFDFSSLNSDEKKTPAMFLISCIISELIKKADTKRMIFIDEAHRLLVNQDATKFYIDLVKTARKRKCGVVSITQNPEDFKEENNSKTILTQSETVFILKQSFASLNYIATQRVFPLSENEEIELPLLGIGEALLIKENEHMLIQMKVFDHEKEIL